MTTHTATIADFVLARLGEDEAVAREADAGPWESWSGATAGGGVYVSGPDETFGIAPGKHGEPAYRQAERTASHIARHDPARVLAQCAAMRDVVEMHREVGGRDLNYAERLELTQVEDGDYLIARDTIRALASIWADHADYRDEWRS